MPKASWHNALPSRGRLSSGLRAPLLMLIVLASAAAGREHRDLVRILQAGRVDVAAIESTGTVVNRIEGDRQVVAEATAAEQRALTAAGFEVELITPDIDEVYHRNAATRSRDAWYMPFEQFRDTMATIAVNNPSFTRLETLGCSVEGRPLLAMKFSDNPDVNEPEPEVHLEANIHGDEAITFAVFVELVKYLAAGYGSDTLLTRLVDEREIWVVPLVNPDGYVAERRYNALDADLNRNWGWMWGNSAAPGTSPMSEPETRSFFAHLLRHPVVLNASYHAGDVFLAYPWSYNEYDTIPDKPEADFLSQRYSSYNGYDYGQGAVGMYPFNGAAKDLEYAWGSITWSVEINYQKWPDAAEIVPTFEENRAAILELCRLAGRGIRGTVRDAGTGAPLAARVELDPGGVPSYTCPELGDFHRFCLPGTYELTFASPGYRDTSIAVTVPAAGDSTAVVDVTLTPDGSFPGSGFRVVYSRFVSTESNRTLPIRALGQRDGDAYRVDGGKYLCIDMLRPVRDRPGADLTVYRCGGSGSVTVKGAVDWTGPWTAIGTATGDETDLDLAATPLDSARYLYFEGTSAFHLDAVTTAGTGAIGGREPGTTDRGPVVRVAGNPGRGRLVFSVSGCPDATGLAVLDAAGRLVRLVPLDTGAATWDGCDRRGRPVAPGVYFARTDDPAGPVARAVLVR